MRVPLHGLFMDRKWGPANFLLPVWIDGTQMRGLVDCSNTSQVHRGTGMATTPNGESPATDQLPVRLNQETGVMVLQAGGL